MVQTQGLYRPRGTRSRSPWKTPKPASPAACCRPGGLGNSGVSHEAGAWEPTGLRARERQAVGMWERFPDAAKGGGEGE